MDAVKFMFVESCVMLGSSSTQSLEMKKAFASVCVSSGRKIRIVLSFKGVEICRGEERQQVLRQLCKCCWNPVNGQQKENVALVVQFNRRAD